MAVLRQVHRINDAGRRGLPRKRVFRDRRHTFEMYGDVKCLIGTVFVVMTSYRLSRFDR